MLSYLDSLACNIKCIVLTYIIIHKKKIRSGYSLHTVWQYCIIAEPNDFLAEKWKFISKGCLKRAQIYRRWQCFTISWNRHKCSTWRNLTQQICCGTQSFVFIVIRAMKHAWLEQYFTGIHSLQGIMFVIYALWFIILVLWRGDRFREQYKSNGLSYGESSYENKREEIHRGSWLCFDLFNPAFEKTQALRTISHGVEEEVFHLLTLLMIHPEISRERENAETGLRAGVWNKAV